MSSEVFEMNKASETSPTEKEISDTATMNIEEPNGDDQSGKEQETTVDEAKHVEHEETNTEKQGGVNTVTNVDDARVANMAVSFMEALYGDSSDDEEDPNWEGDEEESDGKENYEEEETAVDEDKIGVEKAVKEGDQKHAAEDKEIAKGDEGKAGEPNAQKVSVDSKKKVKLNGRVKKVAEDSPGKLASGAKPESSLKKRGKKKVESMGMIFMCSSKTKDDCFQYRILGLPSSKKEMVEKIYPGMRLFLYDIDLKLMYGIFKAAGSGGYNIEPKAFNSKFPSQVRFTVLEDCLPLAEEKFKNVIKENYFTKNKFDGQLHSSQVRSLCKLFSSTRRQQQTQPQPKRLHETRKVETQPRRQETRKSEKQQIHLDTRKSERHPIRQDRARNPKTDDRRRPGLLREERPHKRLRNLISHAAPPPAVPPMLPSDAYRKDPYYLERRDPHVSHHETHIARPQRPIERSDPQYRDVRDPYLDRREIYVVRQADPYIDRRDPYLDRSEPYVDQYPERRDRVDSYVDRRDPYIDNRDSYVRGVDPYKEDRIPDAYRRDQVAIPETYRRDPAAIPEIYRREPVVIPETQRRDLVAIPQTYRRDPAAIPEAYRREPVVIPDTYRRDPVAISETYRRDPVAIPEAYWRDQVAIPDTYKRDPISERPREVYREERGGAVYRDAYRLDRGVDRQLSGVETSRRYDVASQDTYAAYHALPSNGEQMYPGEYPSSSSLARVYGM